MYLTRAPIEPGELASPRSSDGAVVTFAGIVRDHHRGRRVESILYEAYESMAEKEIGRVVAHVQKVWPDVGITVRHRLGRLTVGEISVVIICTSPHRAEAYDASRALIDGIKESVPIWKKERGPDGDEWVGWQWT